MPISWLPMTPQERLIAGSGVPKTAPKTLPWSTSEPITIEMPARRTTMPIEGQDEEIVINTPTSGYSAPARVSGLRGYVAPVRASAPDEIVINTKDMPVKKEFQAWEKPAELATNLTEKIGETIAKTPVLPKIMEWASPLFNFLAGVDKVWGSLVTASASPKLEWQKGENWFTHQMREYDAWESPTYVKGAVEFLNPVWWIPFAGWGAKAAKVIGVGGKALGAIETTAKVMEKVGLSGNYSGFKNAEKVAKAAAQKSSLFAEGKLALPNAQQIAEMHFTADNMQRAAASMDKVPVLKPLKDALNRAGHMDDVIVLAENVRTRRLEPRYMNKMVDGEQAIAPVKDYIAQQAVIQQATHSIASDSMQALLIPQLQRYGNPVKLMRASDNGLTDIVAKQADIGTGTVDIAENFINRTGQIDTLYEGLSDTQKQYLLAVKKVVEQYDQLLVDEFRDAALKELPKGASEAMIIKRARKLAGVDEDNILLPRLVEGKVTPEGFEKSRYGINSELSRTHKTMNEGIFGEAARGYSIKYKNNLNNNVQQFIDNYATKIANHRWKEGIEPLGKTLKESLYAYEPEFMEELAKSGVRVADMNYAERTITSFLSGKANSIPGATVRKIMASPHISQKAKDSITTALKLKPSESKKIIDDVWSQLSLTGTSAKQSTLYSRTTMDFIETFNFLKNESVEDWYKRKGRIDYDTLEEAIPHFDERFKTLFSTYTKVPLKRGETWQSRATNYIEGIKKRELASGEAVVSKAQTRHYNPNIAISKADFIDKILEGKGVTGATDILISDIENALSKLSPKGRPNTKAVINNAYKTLLTNRSRTELMKQAREEIWSTAGSAKEELMAFRSKYAKLKEQYTKGGFSKTTDVTSKVMDEAGNIIETPVVRPYSATLNNPAFQGRLFPTEVIEQAEKLMGDRGNKVFANAASISGWMRTMTAALDFSAPFIQGLPALARNPAAWARATKEHFTAAFAPEKYAGYLAKPDNYAARAERLFYGGTGSISEFHEAMPQVTQALGRVPKIGEKLQSLSKQTLGRTEAAYGAFGEVSRDELWKALRHKAIDKTTGKLDNKLAREVASSIDKLTGSLNIDPLLIGKSQKQFENGFMFFASRYTRAGLALAGDVMRGGLRGSEARKALGSMITGGTLMYLRVCNALGQQPNLDPTTGKFMTVKIGDYNVGIGGITTSLIRFGYDVAASAAEDPSVFLDFGNRFDNPFTKFLYSRAAPLTQTISEVIDNKDFLGEPLDSPEAWARFAASSTIPISFQNFMDDTGAASKVGAFLPELMGGRTFPKSDSELLTEARDRYAQSFGFMSYKDIPATALIDGRKVKDLIAEQPDIQTLSNSIVETNERRGYTEGLRYTDWRDEKEEARAVFQLAALNAEKRYQVGLSTGYDYKESIKKAQIGYAATMEAIDKRYNDVVSEIASNPKTTADIAYSTIMDAYNSGQFEDEYGVWDYDAANSFKESVLSRLSSEDRKAVEDTIKAKDKEMPAMYQEYKYAQEVLKEYWGINDLADKYFKFESTAKERFIARRRKILRAQKKDIDYYLKLFYTREA